MNNRNKNKNSTKGKNTILIAALCGMILIALPIFLIVFMVTDGYNYTKKDVEKYIRNTLLINDFSVEFQEKQSYWTDDTSAYFWKVTESDGFVFNVVDKFYPTNYLTGYPHDHVLFNNRDDLKYREYVEQSGITLSGADLWHRNEKQYLSYSFQIQFADRDDLYSKIDILNDVIRKSPEDASLSFSFFYIQPDNDIRYYYKETTKDELVDPEIVINDMLYFAIDQRNDTILSWFTQDEIDDLFAKEDFYWFYIFKDDEKILCDDLLAGKDRKSISLYGFYDLLNETGYDTLDGTKNNFSIIDQNGHKCEFSDEYELTRKRYYKAEGERIFFECGYDMYLTFDEINDLTGMKLEMYR